METVLSQLFKSAEVHDRGERPSDDADAKSYRKQLTVEELFKGEPSLLFLTRAV